MATRQLTQSDAQKRIEQIDAFEQELIALNNDNLLVLPPTQDEQIKNYHQQLRQQLAQQYDVDISTQAKQLTLGMKIASLLGALAMAVSIFFLFYQFWGYINTQLQVSVLITAPIALLLLSLHLAQQESRAYFAKISALVSLSCFVLNLSMLGEIFNITPSPNAFAVWAAYSFLLAYACNARLLIFFALVSISSFIAIKVGAWSGMYWIDFGERPENFFIPGLLIFMLPQWFNQKKYSGFDVIYRVMAMIIIFMPILVLSNWGQGSYLTWSTKMIEGFYQLIGFMLAGMTIWLGIKYQWREVTNTGNVFFILFLYTKLFDWWWDWMPKYIFFFILGLTALLALIVFKRVRLSHLNTGAAQ